MKQFKKGDMVYRVLVDYIEAENMLYVVIDKGKISEIIWSGIETLITYKVVKNIYTSHEKELIITGDYYEQDRLPNFSHEPLNAKKIFVRHAFEERKY